MERKYKAEIKGLERQLQVKSVQFEEENTQRLGLEIQLKGSHIHLEKVMEEIENLKDQLKEKDDAPMKIQLPECNKCEKSIDQCRYLNGMIFRKDVVIQNLVQNHN